MVVVIEMVVMIEMVVVIDGGGDDRGCDGGCNLCVLNGFSNSQIFVLLFMIICILFTCKSRNTLSVENKSASIFVGSIFSGSKVTRI